MISDITIRIGGQAGQGMQSIGFTMGKTFTRQGRYVFINQDVESRIRGGHSYVQLRVSNEPIYGISADVDILIALDKATIAEDMPDLAHDGVMIFDGEKTDFRSDSPNHLSIPLEQVATEVGKSKITVNTVALGAAFALIGSDLKPLLARFEEQFDHKGQEVIENNKKSASAGYEYVLKNYKGSHPYRFTSPQTEKKKMLISGSESIALGAICSGLKFYAGYPMSPSTGVMEFIASVADKYNIIVEPAEDEIAAINMAIGASFAGARAMTATSGGGFCLMVEGLGLAGMTETPVVVLVAQRPGPATGLPTRTEQADLQFVIHASHGEFPRAVFAPGHAEQAFYAMKKAFNMADTFQAPVIILGDQHLNDSYFTIDHLDLDSIAIKRGHIVSDDAIESVQDYKRYAWSDSGISPRILPGLSEAVVYADSDEHTEVGHITESADIRVQMMKKRMCKMDGMLGEIAPPEVYGSIEANVILLGWGSTFGAVREAVDVMNKSGIQACMVHFSEIYPLPIKSFIGTLSKNAKIFAVENNYTGQFARLFSSEAGLPVFHNIVKYDGRPFSAHEIVSQVTDHL